MPPVLIPRLPPVLIPRFPVVVPGRDVLRLRPGDLPVPVRERPDMRPGVPARRREVREPGRNPREAVRFRREVPVPGPVLRIMPRERPVPDPVRDPVHDPVRDPVRRDILPRRPEPVPDITGPRRFRPALMRPLRAPRRGPELEPGPETRSRLWLRPGDRNALRLLPGRSPVPRRAVAPQLGRRLPDWPRNGEPGVLGLLCQFALQAAEWPCWPWPLSRFRPDHGPQKWRRTWGYLYTP